ncbi:Holliday junction resolvase RuvX [Nakamurella antarctica]|uniref:Putative pre-16S rRNA nuclease n=1 Tax=Nakamurella antarctica TaxID=1902245 RepID=A0A3G8ZQ85_9ACTN|nr:Holliday junction resolvase RuvX [Nakamurella antarctica]
MSSAATNTAAVGVRLGVDVGTVRVGVAISDPHSILATPLQTLARDAKSGKDQLLLVELIAEHRVVEVVVGLPRSLSGREGPAAEAARAYGSALGKRIAPIPVRYVDERLTSVTAERMLRESGVKSRSRRAVVDQVAAVQILQTYLDTAARERGVSP